MCKQSSLCSCKTSQIMKLAYVHWLKLYTNYYVLKLLCTLTHACPLKPINDEVIKLFI